jgi:hypothetical protein
MSQRRERPTGFRKVLDRSSKPITIGRVRFNPASRFIVEYIWFFISLADFWSDKGSPDRYSKIKLFMAGKTIGDKVVERKTGGIAWQTHMKM